MTKIVGIDCSTNSLAFSIFDDKKLLHWGEVSFGKGDIFHRAHNANKMVSGLIQDSMFWGVQSVIYESAVYINNRKTVIDLATVLGAAVAPLVAPGVVCEGVPPVTWQGFIGNKPFTAAEKKALRDDHPDKSATWLAGEMRNIRKRRTMTWVENQFDVVVDSDNISDAIGVGFWKASHAKEVDDKNGS